MIDVPGDLVWDLPCVQQASYLEGGPLMWMLPLYLQVNQKSDYDIWYQDRYWSKVFSSTAPLMAVTLGLRSQTQNLKMLKFSFKILRHNYFITLSLNWFIFGLMKILHRQCPHPKSTPQPHNQRSCQNQGHRIFQKQIVQYQASFPVWGQVLLFFFFLSLWHFPSYIQVCWTLLDRERLGVNFGCEIKSTITKNLWGGGEETY